MQPRAEMSPGRSLNGRVLEARFSARLLEQRPLPTSVLDVGCGRGHLVTELRRAGVRAVGLEIAAPPSTLAGCVVQGDAHALPFADGAFEWVVLRHVAHHLAAPARALAEAVRVSTGGVMVAEPWYDTSLRSQRCAQRADAWSKSLDRRAGHVHHDNLDAGALIALLPADWECEIERYLCLRRQAWQDFLADVEPHLRDADDRARLAELESECREGMSWNGTIILTARRPPA